MSEQPTTLDRTLDIGRLQQAIKDARAEYPGLFVDWAAATEHTCRAIANAYAAIGEPHNPGDHHDYGPPVCRICGVVGMLSLSIEPQVAASEDAKP